MFTSKLLLYKDIKYSSIQTTVIRKTQGAWKRFFLFLPRRTTSTSYNVAVHGQIMQFGKHETHRSTPSSGTKTGR